MLQVSLIEVSTGSPGARIFAVLNTRERSPVITPTSSGARLAHVESDARARYAALWGQSIDSRGLENPDTSSGAPAHPRPALARQARPHRRVRRAGPPPPSSRQSGESSSTGRGSQRFARVLSGDAGVPRRAPGRPSLQLLRWPRGVRLESPRPWRSLGWAR